MTLRTPITAAMLCCTACMALAGAGVLPERNAARVDSLMSAGLKAGYYPGACVAIGNSETVLFESCYGWQDYTGTVPVTPEDIYDVASVTKVVSTTLAVMRLYDMSLIGLDDRLDRLLPQFSGTPIAAVTVRELLTHTSGLGNIKLYSLIFSNPDGGPLTKNRRDESYPFAVDSGTYLCRNSLPDPFFISADPIEDYRRAGESCYVNPAIDTLIENRITASYKASQRGKYLYSDLNFHLLKLAVEKLAGQRLDLFVAPMYGDMRMKDTGYRPLEWKNPDRIIPTEDDRLMKRGLLRGYTHDEIGAVSDNVGGNAGLFSNASDLGNFCRMILCGGEFEGRRIISRSTVKLFTACSPRPLGVMRLTSNPSFEGGFGHTGYTGTMIWMDPARDLYMVFLSNRVNPSRTNRGLVNSTLRAKVWEAAVKK